MRITRYISLVLAIVMCSLGVSAQRTTQFVKVEKCHDDGAGNLTSFYELHLHLVGQPTPKVAGAYLMDGTPYLVLSGGTVSFGLCQGTLETIQYHVVPRCVQELGTNTSIYQIETYEDDGTRSVIGTYDETGQPYTIPGAAIIENGSCDRSIKVQALPFCWNYPNGTSTNFIKVMRWTDESNQPFNTHRINLDGSFFSTPATGSESLGSCDDTNEFTNVYKCHSENNVFTSFYEVTEYDKLGAATVIATYTVDGSPYVIPATGDVFLGECNGLTGTTELEERCISYEIVNSATPGVPIQYSSQYTLPAFVGRSNVVGITYDNDGLSTLMPLNYPYDLANERHRDNVIMDLEAFFECQRWDHGPITVEVEEVSNRFSIARLKIVRPSVVIEEVHTLRRNDMDRVVNDNIFVGLALENGDNVASSTIRVQGVAYYQNDQFLYLVNEYGARLYTEPTGMIFVDCDYECDLSDVSTEQYKYKPAEPLSDFCITTDIGTARINQTYLWRSNTTKIDTIVHGSYTNFQLEDFASDITNKLTSVTYIDQTDIRFSYDGTNEIEDSTQVCFTNVYGVDSMVMRINDGTYRTLTKERTNEYVTLTALRNKLGGINSVISDGGQRRYQFLPPGSKKVGGVVSSSDQVEEKDVESICIKALVDLNTIANIDYTFPLIPDHAEIAAIHVRFLGRDPLTSEVIPLNYPYNSFNSVGRSELVDDLIDYLSCANEFAKLVEFTQDTLRFVQPTFEVVKVDFMVNRKEATPFGIVDRSEDPILSPSVDASSYSRYVAGSALLEDGELKRWSHKYTNVSFTDDADYVKADCNDCDLSDIAVTRYVYNHEVPLSTFCFSEDQLTDLVPVGLVVDKYAYKIGTNWVTRPISVSFGSLNRYMPTMHAMHGIPYGHGDVSTRRSESGSSTQNAYCINDVFEVDSIRIGTTSGQLLYLDKTQQRYTSELDVYRNRLGGITSVVSDWTGNKFTYIPNGARPITAPSDIYSIDTEYTTDSTIPGGWRTVQIVCNSNDITINGIAYPAGFIYNVPAMDGMIFRNPIVITGTDYSTTVVR